MGDQSKSPGQLTEDETRLLIFYRALTPSQQFTLLENAGSQAMARCVPCRGIYSFAPVAGGIDPDETAISDIDDDGEFTRPFFEIIRDGAEAMGEPTSYLLGSDARDERWAIPRFANAAQETADRQGTFFNYDRQFARTYIREWRMWIAHGCEIVATRMARTVAEAETQRVVVPDNEEDWIDFALTLDGEQISRELGWEPPGEMDCDLRGTLAGLDSSSGVLWLNGRAVATTPLSPVLIVRLNLYQRLRYLQLNDELPCDCEQLEEIEEVLSWLRDHMTYEET